MTTQSPNRVYSDANFLTRQDFRGSNNPLVTPYPPSSHPYMMGAFLPPPPTTDQNTQLLIDMVQRMDSRLSAIENGISMLPGIES